MGNSSTLVHEAALAVAQISTPEKFHEFFFLLMSRQNEFYDAPCDVETPRATRARLAALAGTIGIDTDTFVKLLTVGEGNSGNKVTNDLKYFVKIGRQNGIHVTPTVLLDGLVDPSVSSGMSEEQWAAYLKEKILV